MFGVAFGATAWDEPCLRLLEQGPVASEEKGKGQKKQRKTAGSKKRSNPDGGASTGEREGKRGGRKKGERQRGLDGNKDTQAE